MNQASQYALCRGKYYRVFSLFVRQNVNHRIIHHETTLLHANSMIIFTMRDGGSAGAKHDSRMISDSPFPFFVGRRPRLVHDCKRIRQQARFPRSSFRRTMRINANNTPPTCISLLKVLFLYLPFRSSCTRSPALETIGKEVWRMVELHQSLKLHLRCSVARQRGNV